MKNLLVACLSLASLSFGTPISRRDDVTVQELNNLELYAQWSFAAYCNSKRSVGDPIICNEGECDLIYTANTTIAATFDGLVSDIQGFLAIDPVANQIVLSLRGSSSIQNFVTDVLFTQLPCDLTAGCLAHAGFYTAWNEISVPILTAVGSAAALHPNYDIVVTGHSLGGAVATLAAAYLRAGGHSADLYTYGSPRVGNLAFASYVTNQAGAEYRVTHADDPVPRLPPILFGYRHTSPEYWIDPDDQRGTVTTALVDECDGYSNTDCNAGTSGLDIGAHSWYFQQTGACATGGARMTRDGGISEADLETIVSHYAELDVFVAKQLHDQGLQ